MLYLAKQDPPKTLSTRWADIIKPQQIEEIDGDAIVADIIERAGLEVI